MNSVFSNVFNKLLQYLKLSIQALKESSVRTMLWLGFSAGLPLMLLFSTLSVWLNEAGINKSTITLFSWAAMGNAFKFVWAPLIDQAQLPILSHKLGKRRAWLLLSQTLLLLVILLMSFINPAASTNSLWTMAILAMLLGFISATQDIVIDAFRIEITPKKLLGVSAATYQWGYRLAMVAATAFAFRLASHWGSDKHHYHYEAWQKTYWIMAVLMLVGILATLFAKEPKHRDQVLDSAGSKQLLQLLLLLLVPFIGFHFLWNAMVMTQKFDALPRFILSVNRFAIAVLLCYWFARQLIVHKMIDINIAAKAYWHPVSEFIQRYPKKAIIWLFLLIGFYRVSDMVLGTIANVFYEDIGFSKQQFADASKVFGVIMTLVGLAIGGVLVARIGTMKTLFWGAVLSALTNLLFMLLAYAGNQLWLLYAVICADNLAAGIATTAFITFLSRLSNIQFTAMQYAIFSSVMVMLPRIIGGYSGAIVEATSYPTFFFITTLMGIPIMALVYYVSTLLTLDENQPSMS